MNRSLCVALAALTSAALVGCAAGGVDVRMIGQPEEMIDVDGLPTYVIFVPVGASGRLYDVESGEGRTFAGGTANQPLVFRDRMRRATQIAATKRFGEGGFKVVDETSATVAAKVWTRIEVQSK